MFRLFIASLLITGATASAQQPTETPGYQYETRKPDPKQPIDNAWKPKLQVQLQMNSNAQRVPQGRAPVAATEVASVFCDNISVNVTSGDNGQSQYSLNCTTKAHVRVAGLQIECATLEITNGQLSMTEVRIVQQGRTITTEKLSMTLPVYGVNTTQFGNSLEDPGLPGRDSDDDTFDDINRDRKPRAFGSPEMRRDVPERDVPAFRSSKSPKNTPILPGAKFGKQSA